MSQYKYKNKYMKNISDEVNCRYSFDDLFPKAVYNLGDYLLELQEYKALLGLEDFTNEYHIPEYFICGKRKFSSALEAEINLERVQVDRGNKDNEKKVHYCKLCKCFHLTSLDY